MPLFVSSAVFAFLVTTACAIVLMKRSSNRRIRLLAFSIGLPPLCQSVILVGNHQAWIAPVIGRAAEFLELPASALCLAAVYLLNRENENRKTTDARLRVAEHSPVPETGRAQPSESRTTLQLSEDLAQLARHLQQQSGIPSGVLASVEGGLTLQIRSGNTLIPVIDNPADGKQTVR